DGVRSEAGGLLDLGDLDDLGLAALGVGGRREEKREGCRGRKGRLRDPDHALRHHDHVRAASDRFLGSRFDVSQRFEELGRRHAVIQRADHRHPRRIDDALHAHRLADTSDHDNLLPGPRRSTVNSNASARWYSYEESTGAPSSEKSTCQIASRSSPRGMFSRRATVTSALTGRKLATPWWIAIPRSRSSTS